MTASRDFSPGSKYERGERRLDFVEVLEVAEVLQADLCVLVTELSGVTRGEVR